MTGFTRLEAPEPEVNEQSHIVKLKCSSGEKWLPAVEINGEGVFIELNKEKINQWMQIEIRNLVLINMRNVMQHIVRKRMGEF